MFFIFIFALLILEVNSECPSNFLEWNSNCYLLNSNSAGFADAEFNCKNVGGHLASIHDGFTNAWLAQEGGKNFTKSTNSDFWIGGTTLIKSPNWNWTDGSSFDFTDWKKGEPQNVSGSNCASLSMTDGLWTAADCFKSKPFVCEIPSIIPSPTYPSWANCSEGWFYLAATGSCYGVGPGGYFSNWTASEAYCQTFGAHLPSVHSVEEFEYLLSYLYIAWANFWTGIFSADGGHTWVTSDGSAADFLKYKKWCPESPQNVTGERCVAVEQSDKLNHVGCYWSFDCNSYTARTLCKKMLF